MHTVSDGQFFPFERGSGLYLYKYYKLCIQEWLQVTLRGFKFQMCLMSKTYHSIWVKALVAKTFFSKILKESMNVLYFSE